MPSAVIKMKFLLSIVLVSFYLKYTVTLDCYWNSEYKYKYFSSKTPYEIVRGDIRDSIVKPEGCEVVSVWAIMRHGKRNPSLKYARGIKEILKYKDFIISSYESGNSSLCAQDIENIKYWDIDTEILDNPNEIANEGYQELMGIGRRIREALPELLVNELQRDDYLFRPAFGQRMIDSARAFAEGFYDRNNVTIENDNDYSIVSPYSICGKFQVEILRNPINYHEAGEYMKTVDFIKMTEQVEKKIGLNFTISNDKIVAMYDLCRYSWDGIKNRPSPWCALFATEDLQVLEYIGDLSHYYRNGYGAKHFSKSLGQIPLADLLINFEQAKEGKEKKIVSYFTHATMMDMILVALNLYKDANPLMGAHRDVYRKWRTTFLSTFSSNMIAVLYRCSEHSESTYKVAFYWNEMPLLELCDKGVCSWQEFQTIFSPFLNASTDVCEYEWTKLD